MLPASGNTVYLIPDPFDISKNIKDWLHSSILEVLKSDIQKIQFFQTSPKLSIINKEKGKEIFECNGLKDGDTAKSWVIDQIASMFEQFELKDIHLAASEQFKNKEFIQNIKVHTFPGLIYEIALMEENDSAYIKIQCFSDKTEINDIAEDKNKTFSKWIYEIEPWVASNIKKKYEDIAETPEITSTNNQQSTEIKENPDISPDEQPEEPKIG